MEGWSGTNARACVINKSTCWSSRPPTPSHPKGRAAGQMCTGSQTLPAPPSNRHPAPQAGGPRPVLRPPQSPFPLRPPVANRGSALKSDVAKGPKPSELPTSPPAPWGSGPRVTRCGPIHPHDAPLPVGVRVCGRGGAEGRVGRSGPESASPRPPGTAGPRGPELGAGGVHETAPGRWGRNIP